MVASAAAFIKSRARRSFGFWKPCLFANLLREWSINGTLHGIMCCFILLVLVETSSVNADNDECIREQGRIFFEFPHIFVLGICHGWISFQKSVLLL